MDALPKACTAGKLHRTSGGHARAIGVDPDAPAALCRQRCAGKEARTMTQTTGRFTIEEAERLGTTIGIDWASSPFDVEQFAIGLDVELEHGAHDPETNVTDDDPILTAKIAWAHLKELPDYYTRLVAMERQAEA
jgi:hypothetical protein